MSDVKKPLKIYGRCDQLLGATDSILPTGLSKRREPGMV